MTEKKRSIGFFGIGIFVYLCISSSAEILEEIFRDVFINLGLNPFWTFWISQFSGIITYFILIYLAMRKISNNYESLIKKIPKYLLLSFILYFILQGILIVYPSIQSALLPDQYNDRFSEYSKFLIDKYYYYYIIAAMYFIVIILIMKLIYREVKNGGPQRV